MAEAPQLSSTTMQNGSTDHPILLWEHADPRSTKMYEFLELVNKKYEKKLQTYEDLYQWSISNIAYFWKEVWKFTGVVAEMEYQKVAFTFQEA
jgi:acetoacetyl-CoA synthetase